MLTSRGRPGCARRKLQCFAKCKALDKLEMQRISTRKSKRSWWSKGSHASPHLLGGSRSRSTLPANGIRPAREGAADFTLVDHPQPDLARGSEAGLGRLRL